jgi:subtilisin-like proprotein convertase family protein
MKTPTAILGLLLLFAALTPLRAQVTESHTFTTNRVVPDGNAAGLSDARFVNSAIASIASVKVRLRVVGEFNGDLYAYVRHQSGFTVLLNRPGRTASDGAGYDDSGFDVTFQSGAANGDVHMYRNVVAPPAGSPLTGVWEPDGRTADPGVVTDASARTALLGSFNGLNAAGDWTLYLVDLENGGTNLLAGWGLEITGAVYPAIDWPFPADIVYGTPLGAAQLNATATYNGTNVNGAFDYTPGAGTVLNAGDEQILSVTFTPADTTSFLAISSEALLNVLRAPLTIAADDKSKVYGSANPPLTATYTGLVNGDTPASLDTPVTLNTMAMMSSPVGDYPITASGGMDANYDITHVNGTLAVTRAPLTVTAENKTKVYGAPLPEFTAIYSGFVLGEDTNHLTALATLTTPATAASDAGTYPITPAGAASPNYSFNYVPGVLTITQSLTLGAISSSANPAVPGADVTFTFTVGAMPPGAGTPGGTVNFRIDGAVAGSASLAGGVAAFIINTLSLGSHTVVAEYAGDVNFVGVTNALSPDQVINTPPVAGNDTLERYPTQDVKVRLGTLLANDSDADGDALAITVSATSANGGSVSVRGQWVFYAPPSGSTNTDSFTYQIADGRGASATGTVFVVIKVDNDPGANLSIIHFGGSTYYIQGNGIPGRTYRLQSTDTLGPPAWTNLPGGSVTADPIGIFDYIDASGSAMRYYRSVYP